MSGATRPGLLVSVRSVEEAAAALAGGADLIDVKEPARGALGRADDAVTAEVMRFVAGRRPVSAALGELCEAIPCRVTGLSFAKWGLAGAAASDWRDRLLGCIRQRHEIDPACRAVAVAYADWQRVGAPTPEAVIDFAAQHGAALLVDTFTKGQTLLKWLSIQRIGTLVGRCREGEVAIALAGSLGQAEVERLGELRPDWFAVRGAACRDGRRDQPIDVDRIRCLKAMLLSRQPG